MNKYPVVVSEEEMGEISQIVYNAFKKTDNLKELEVLCKFIDENIKDRGSAHYILPYPYYNTTKLLTFDRMPQIALITQIPVLAFLVISV